MPGRRCKPLHRVGKLAAMLALRPAGAFQQVARAGVVAKPGPFAHDRRILGRRQRRTVGQRLVKLWKYSLTAATVVCCSMTSDNQNGIGVRYDTGAARLRAAHATAGRARAGHTSPEGRRCNPRHASVITPLMRPIGFRPRKARLTPSKGNPGCPPPSAACPQAAPPQARVRTGRENSWPVTCAARPEARFFRGEADHPLARNRRRGGGRGRPAGQDPPCAWASGPRWSC